MQHGRSTAEPCMFWRYPGVPHRILNTCIQWRPMRRPAHILEGYVAVESMVEPSDDSGYIMSAVVTTAMKSSCGSDSELHTPEVVLRDIHSNVSPIPRFSSSRCRCDGCEYVVVSELGLRDVLQRPVDYVALVLEGLERSTSKTLIGSQADF